MTRTTLATLAALLIAAALAFQLGGREGAGVVAGVLCGAAVANLGALWQRHAFRHHAERAFRSVVEVFLFKLAFVLLGALAFRYVEAAAARVDWKAFLVTFAAAALLVQTVAVFESVRLLRRPAAPIGPAATPTQPTTHQP